MKTKSDTRIVLIGGCFDVLHYGHIRFLKEAKNAGDYLLVALESDDNVKRRKGKLRPIHTQEQRKIMLESLAFVDEVLSLPTMTTDQEYENVVLEIKPTIIAVTEGDSYLELKKRHAKKIQATVLEIPKIHTPSTSQLSRLIGLE